MKRIRWFWLSFLIVFTFLVLGLVAPQLPSRNLKYFNEEKYNIAVKISQHPSFTKGEIEFRVCYGPFTQLFKAGTIPNLYPRKIFLSPRSIDSSFFDVIIGHELGHLQYEHSWSVDHKKGQMEADSFAADIFGKERVRASLISSGYSEDHYLIKNLED